MGFFGHTDSEPILGSGKHEIRTIYVTCYSEGDGTNIKARVYSAADGSEYGYNSTQNTAEVTSIEEGDDGTYFAYPTGYNTVIAIKAAALDGTPVAVLSVDGNPKAANNNTPCCINGALGTGTIQLAIRDMTRTLVDIRSWAADKGFTAWVTYITAAS